MRLALKDDTRGRDVAAWLAPRPVREEGRRLFAEPRCSAASAAGPGLLPGPDPSCCCLTLQAPLPPVCGGRIKDRRGLPQDQPRTGSVSSRNLPLGAVLRRRNATKLKNTSDSGTGRPLDGPSPSFPQYIAISRMLGHPLLEERMNQQYFAEGNDGRRSGHRSQHPARP